MKEIFGQYGGAVIAVLAALAVIGTLRGNGPLGGSELLEPVGEVWVEQTSQEPSGILGEHLDYFYRQTCPEVRYRKDAPVSCGRRIRLEDHFYTEDVDFPERFLTVLSLTDLSGNPYPMEKNEDGTYLTFETAGVYRAQFLTADGKKKSRRSAVYFPVQEP